MQRADLPKHPSYGQRPVPSLQLLAKLSKFNGSRLDNIVNKKQIGPPCANETVGNIEPAPLLPSHMSLPETEENLHLDPSYNQNKPHSADSFGHRYKYNSHMNSTVGKMIHEPTMDAENSYFPSKRMSGPQISNCNNSLIGGVPPDGDPFVTVTQQMQNGMEMEKKSSTRKKPHKEFDAELFISPITGEQIGNYGTWVADMRYKDQHNSTSVTAEVEDDPIMAKLKAQLAARGARGIIGLGRMFKIADDDSSNNLSFQEFKKAMRDIGMTLNDAELIILFKRFDASNIGSISYNDFLTTIAGKLNHKRKRLVQQAFDILDKDKSGEITLDDIALAYNCSRHPDVLSGKKTSDQVLLEFLDGFDVGGTKDGKVTLQEFERYYSSISASIPSDDYFELMIRNAWHISGGEGAAANSANMRVLATFADGSQRIVEVNNDLGLNPNDRSAIISRLQAQGLNVISVSPNDNVVDNSTQPFMKRSTSVQNTARKPIPRSTVNDSVPIAAEPSAGLKLIISKIKKEMACRGSGGFVALQRRFRIMDDDGNKSLNLAEFKKALRELKMDLTEGDMRILFKYFDRDDSGAIDFNEFIQGVRDPLNDRRLTLVNMAFLVLDKDESGIVDASEIATMYDPSKHPEVLAKRKSANQVLKEFLDTFDVGGVKDGKVTKEEFVNYYTNVGASIDNDDYFELMIRNAWHLNGGEGQAASSSNMKILVTFMNGKEATITLENDLGIKKDDLAKIYTRLRSQGVENVYAVNGKVIKVVNINGVEIVATTGETSKLEVANAVNQPNVLRAPPIVRRPHSATSNRLTPKPMIGGSGKVEYASANSNSIRTDVTKLTNGVIEQLAKNKRVNEQKAADSIVGNTLLDVLRVQLLAKGRIGIIDLQRKFIEMDADGSKSLDYAEFKNSLANANIAFSQDQLQSLFTFLDRDGSGSIDYTELLLSLRGPINPKLLVLIHRAFDKIDTVGNGNITPQQLVSNFAVDRHPDVIAGIRNADSVMQEFLDSFDVGAVEVGKVTRDEFVTYFHNLVAATNDDDYMELVLRRTWMLGEDPLIVQKYEKQVLKDFAAKSSGNGDMAKSNGGMIGRIRSARNFSEEYWGTSNAAPPPSSESTRSVVQGSIGGLTQNNSNSGRPQSARSWSHRR